MLEWYVACFASCGRKSEISRAPLSLMRRLARTLALAGSGSVFCLSAVSSSSSSRSPALARPTFTFGVIADVQWADTEDGYNFDRTVVRCYRGAFRTLGRAVDYWCALASPPNFIAQLGDIIDGVNVQLGGTQSAMTLALGELDRAPCEAVNIVGNHELVCPRPFDCPPFD